MTASSLVLVGVLTPSAGILGALLWPAVQRRLGLSSLRVLILLIVAASFVPLYGVIGLFAPHGARWGLRVPAEMFVLAVYFGALYGAFQSYARALYAEIIPPGEEARWYGLYSITDKVGVYPPWSALERNCTADSGRNSLHHLLVLSSLASWPT
jgi:MFS transporter, UMF1 family